MGSRSTGKEVRGVKRILVRLPGFYVSGEICVPRAHPHALWLLPCVERLLEGASFDDVLVSPPWPVPRDALIVRQLIRELIDLGWAVPRWSGQGVEVASRLAGAFGKEGRAGLARELSVVENRTGEWWMEALGGTILSRQRAIDFDWDFHTRADIVLSSTHDPQELLGRAEPELALLLAKLAGSGLQRIDRDRAFLQAPLVAGSRKDILFPLFGEEPRILPDLLAELEPALDRHAPHVFGQTEMAADPAPRPVTAPRVAVSPRPSPGRADSPRPASITVSKEVHPTIRGVMSEMIRVPAGSFRMGDDRVRNERPRHRVMISRPFLLGRAPVTQALWQSVTGSLPFLREHERHPEFPIIYVGYDEIRRFLDRLNALPGGGAFDLPTEAQWEYACRAGSDSYYCFGNDPSDGDKPGILERFAWTKRSDRRGLQRVGLLQPNAWGLCDMHGLVYETMRDGYRPYDRAEVVDPIGPLDDRQPVARGGFWGRFPLDRRGNPEAEHFRSASRQFHEKSHRVSFRLMRHMDGE